MNMNNVIYWLKNQVAITYQANDLTPSTPPPTIATAITSYRNELNTQVLKTLNYTLIPLKTGNVQQQATINAAPVVDDLDGVYLFGPPASSAIGPPDPTIVVVFYHVVPNMDQMTAAMSTAGSMDDTTDHTLAVVNELNNHTNALQTLKVPAFNALPHWVQAGTPEGTHGCPLTPPIPVEDSGTPGQWQLFPLLADPSLQNKTGEGVTVFVLDTLPPLEHITGPQHTSTNNLLLRKMLTGMASSAPFNAAPPAININYFDTPASPPAGMAEQDMPSPDSPEMITTGKDVYGRLVGFPMSDHGLAVAGIIRDLVPNATIECIRVLNDFGVGTLKTLVGALQHIHNRMSNQNPETRQPGDLYQKPVVINLSLVIGPPESDLPRLGLDRESIKPYLKGLNTLLQSLASVGAIFAASAGNDADPRDTSMNPSEVRFGPRYPANFLYENPPVTRMIPVSAVNRQGKATLYSNYPGDSGIATYGGDLPKPDPWMPSAMLRQNTRVDTTEIDALRGVYSAPWYPALSRNDHYPTPTSPMPATDYPCYQPTTSSAWAYWSGTSFATPIISAIAARVLQGKDPKSINIREAILSAAGKQTVMWSSLETSADTEGPMIMAMQEWSSDSPPKS